jgi:hypothetical protein
VTVNRRETAPPVRRTRSLIENSGEELAGEDLGISDSDPERD